MRDSSIEKKVNPVHVADDCEEMYISVRAWQYCHPRECVC